MSKSETDEAWMSSSVSTVERGLRNAGCDSGDATGGSEESQLARGGSTGGLSDLSLRSRCFMVLERFFGIQFLQERLVELRARETEWASSGVLMPLPLAEEWDEWEEGSVPSRLRGGVEMEEAAGLWRALGLGSTRGMSRGLRGDLEEVATVPARC
jgi:hypothetical protein